MDTVMRYGVGTDPSTLQASPATGDLTKVSMTIVVSNPTYSAVTLEGLIVTLPIGDSGTDLTADWKAIGPVPAPHWHLNNTTTSAGQVQYVFWPCSGHGAVDGEGLSFVFDNIEVNRQPGTFKVVVTEGSGGCDPSSNCPKFCKPISKFPNGWGQVSFWVDPADMPQGGEVYLHWDGPAAAPPNVVTYEIEYTDQQTQKIVRIPGEGQPALPAKGQYPPSTSSGIILQQTTEFTLNVSATFERENYHSQHQRTVTVAKPFPKITRFTAAWEGASLRFHWQTEHTDHVEISHIGGDQKANGNDNDNDRICFQLSPQDPLPASFTLTAKQGDLSAASTLVQQGYEQVSGSPVSTGIFPFAVAVSPDGARVFVANYSEINLTVLDAHTLEPVPGSPVSTGRPWLRAVAISPNGARVFVTTEISLTVLDAHTLKPVPGSPVSTGRYPQPVAVSPDGARVFVADLADNNLTVLDAHTLEPLPGSPVSTGYEPTAVAVSPDRTRVFVANYSDNNLTVLDAHTLKPVLGSPISTGHAPIALAVSPDSGRVFVANYNDNNLTVLDAHTLKPVPGSPVSTGYGPTAVAVSPDSGRDFVANYNDNNLTVLDAHTLKPVPGSPVSTGRRFVRAVAMSPDGGRVFVANYYDNNLTVLSPAFVPAADGELP